MFEEVEPTIERVERLYRTMTGKAVPAGDAVYAAIPLEKDPQQYVEQQLDKLLAMLGSTASTASAHEARWSPPVSVYERADQLVICVDVPGVAKESLQIEVLPGFIAVSGHRAAPVDDDGRPLPMLRVEPPTGQFQRLIPVPATGGGQIVAQLAAGVLELRVPRAQPTSEPRRLITVQ